MKHNEMEQKKKMRTRVQRITATVAMIVLLAAGLALAQSQMVDINTADVEGLMSLKGIGEQKAQAIIKYREMNGPFQSLDDLQNVPGIGEKTVANNQGMMTIGDGMSSKEGIAGSEKAVEENPKKGAMEKATKGMADTAPKTKKAMPDKK